MDYMALLKNHDLKVTPQRLEIVNIVSGRGHINIDELYENLKSKFLSISLSTIYKNINTMIEKGFLLEVKIPEQKNVYELIKEEHSHIICTSCKKVMDINLDVSSLIDQAQKDSKYLFSGSAIVLNGTCPECLHK